MSEQQSKAISITLHGEYEKWSPGLDFATCLDQEIQFTPDLPAWSKHELERMRLAFHMAIDEVWKQLRHAINDIEQWENKLDDVDL